MAASGSMPPSSSAASPPAISSAWLRATGDEAVRRDVQGHHRDMGRRIALALELGGGSVGSPVQQVVERDDAVRQAGAEAADVADREQLRRHLHREFAHDRRHRCARR